MISRRGLFGVLATFKCGPRQMICQPGPIHEHKWEFSPWLVTEVGPEPPLRLRSLEVCAVKGCGMLRVHGGDDEAGKAHIEDK
jgi:hypothetical protein